MALSGKTREKKASSLFMVVIWFILIIASTSFPWWEFNEFSPQKAPPHGARFIYVLPAKEVVVGKFVYQEFSLKGETSFSANLSAAFLVMAILLIFLGMIFDLLPGTGYTSHILILASALYNILSCLVFYFTISDALWSLPRFMKVFGSSAYDELPLLYRTTWGLGIGYYIAVLAAVLLLVREVRFRYTIGRR